MISYQYYCHTYMQAIYQSFRDNLWIYQTMKRDHDDGTQGEQNQVSSVVACHSYISGCTPQGESSQQEYYEYDSTQFEFYRRTFAIDSWDPKEEVKVFGAEQEVDKVKTVEFKKLHLRNHIFLVKDLACQSNNDRFTYIAKHYFDKNSVKKHQSLGTQYYFQLKVEKGEETVKKGTHVAHEANELWEKGTKEVIQWLIDIIEGILELQEAGIFHADMAIRNTIKINNKYKIIDFDLAFKVKEGQSQQGKCAFEHIKVLLKYMLNNASKDDYLIYNYLFRNMHQKYCRKIKSVHTIKDKKISDEQKIQQLIVLMQEYSLVYHKVQLYAILQQILNAQKCIINKKISTQLLNKVFQLDTIHQIISFLKELDYEPIDIDNDLTSLDTYIDAKQIEALMQELQKQYEQSLINKGIKIDNRDLDENSCFRRKYQYYQQIKQIQLDQLPDNITGKFTCIKEPQNQMWQKRWNQKWQKRQDFMPLKDNIRRISQRKYYQNQIM